MYMGWGLVGHKLLVLDLVLAIYIYILYGAWWQHAEKMDREAQHELLMHATKQKVSQ